MRTTYSSLNIIAGLGNQLILTILGFVSRTVFIQSLGAEYLGINGLLMNILGLLSLAEAGIGSSIVYSLYKPVAENDQHQINLLMKLYKQAYLVIACIVFILGMAIFPFLGHVAADANVEQLPLIYFIFLLNTVAPYLYVHKISFLNVCQKNYIVTAIYSVSSILSVCFKIGILYFTQNYVLYLSIDSVLTLSNSVILALLVNKLYPFLKQKVSGTLNREARQQIVTNIKAIVLQNVGVYLIFGTDHLMIASFVSITAVGIYSNYTMLIEMARSFVNQVFNNIYHSIGNLVAQEGKEKVYRVYKAYRLLNFWLYSVIAGTMYILIQPFIEVWLGSSFMLGAGTVLILMISFYERGMRNSITTIKTTSGIFREDRYSSLCQAAVNLTVSLLLVRYYGIAGVLVGTLISALTIPFWYTPYLVYKHVFKKPVYSYFANYAAYAALGAGACWAAFGLSQVLVPGVSGFFDLLWRGLICLVVFNLIYGLVFYRTEEFKYLLAAFKYITSRLPLKILKKQEQSA